MKKLFLAGAMALALSGCTFTDLVSEVTGATVTPQQAQVAINLYNAAEGIATGYLQSCHALASSAHPCAKAAETDVVTSVRAYRPARDAVQKLLRDNAGGPIPIASYNTLTGAANAIQAVLNKYSISAN